MPGLHNPLLKEQALRRKLSHPFSGQKAQPVLRIPECTIPFITASQVRCGQSGTSQEGPKGTGCSLGSVFILLGCFFSLPVPFHQITQPPNVTLRVLRGRRKTQQDLCSGENTELGPFQCDTVPGQLGTSAGQGTQS